MQAALKITLPMMLRFIQLFKHVHTLCFDVIQEVASMSSPALLKPFVLELVPLLLESLGMMENYRIGEMQY